MAVDSASTHMIGISMDRMIQGPPIVFSANALIDAPASIGKVGMFHIGSAVAAPAGNDRFHIVSSTLSGMIHQQTALSYQTFSKSGIGAPVSLGVGSVFDTVDYGLQVVSDGARRAFVSWHDPKTMKLQARFIELAE